MGRKTKNLKTKNTTVLILSEGKAKKCNGGGSETIFFRYLKTTKLCLQKFVKIEDAKRSDPYYMIKEAKQKLQDGACSKVYLVFDYDNQTQEQLRRIEK